MQKTDIRILCADQYPLAGTLYQPKEAAKAAVLFAPATGIKKEFYNSLATHLAELGYGCLTFENRGIGNSLQGKLKDCPASLLDWGQLDLPAAFTALKNAFTGVNYHIVGHSAGGQLVGLMPDWADIHTMFNVACSSGQLDNMENPFRRQGRFFMDIFIPLSNRVFGYTKSQWFGMGEPLPAQVAQDWADWCNGAGYVATAFGKSIHTHWYDHISCPSLWLNATDDDIANNANVDDMTRIFTKLPVERITLNPTEEGLAEIGHMKFFSRKSSKLWQHLTGWLEKYA